MSSTYTRQRSSSMNSLNSNHSSYSTPQPPPINVLSPHATQAPTVLQHNILPPFNTHQQPQPPLMTRHSASPGLVSSSSTTTNNNAFEFSPPPPPPPPHSLPINPHANSISPTSTAATTTTTTTSANNNNKNDIISTPTLSSANINTVQNVAPTPSSTRSMSIVSLERSARNSIVSVDENLRYHARNDSSASLASLGHVNHNTFTMTPAGNSYPNRHDYGFDQSVGDPKMKTIHVGSDVNNQGSAILTDDESEYDTNMNISGATQSSDTLRTVPTTPTLGATTSSTTSSTTSGSTAKNIAKPTHRPKRRSFKDEISLQHLKNDFKFKFHDMYTTPSTIPTSPVSYHHTNSHIYSLNASPNSETLIHGGRQLQNDSPLEDNNHVFTSPGLSHEAIGKTLDSPEMRPTVSLSSFSQSSGPTKKSKSTSLIQQSLYLKRKLAFSKDLQIEFNNASDLTGSSSNSSSNSSSGGTSATTTDAGSPKGLNTHLITMSPPLSTALSEAKFFAHLPATMVSRRRVSSSLNDAEKSAKGTSESAKTSLTTSSNVGISSKEETKMSINDLESSTTGTTPMTPLRAMQSVKEQNDLITKLNKKWNKAMINSGGNNTNSSNSDAASSSSSSGSGGGSSSSTNNKTNNDNTHMERKASKGGTSGSSLDESNALTMIPNKRKRSRRDSFDEADSFDDFNYDNYD
ncbi:hypothetical protein CANMA_001205 [Candida margitis]|uniref:uncharacterized protein n=1 Tax=Candida margitis TaxID=1775924 RepID=UPI002225FE95|nr:uncharacterized protein CANMA_001205 [Candida margitis]KAI5969743.1 hypothetical protein CANMA_001205 [Candida margitis]